MAGIYKGGKTLSIMPTFTCTAACASCGTLSHPKEGTNLSVDRILEAITEAKELNFINVVFTGGEATLRWNDLKRSIRHARDLGLLTRIVTNAHWAHSLEKAECKLSELMEAGLDEINFSTGDEHVRFIPIERVVFATLASALRNFRVHVMIELKSERQVTKEIFLGHPLFAELSDSQRAVISVGESPWMPLDPGEVESYPEGVAINNQNISASRGCESILATYTLQADGRIGACCGLGMRQIAELNVSNVNTGNGSLTKAIETSENDLLKLWIRYMGPDKILKWAAEKNPEIKWENMYGHHCQACHRLYKDEKVAAVIMKHHQEIDLDVIQMAWLEENYIPAKLLVNDTN